MILFEELKLEILAVRKFKDKIPMLEKLAIVQQDSGKVFLVEGLLIPYEEFKEDIKLKDKALQIVANTKKIFKNGDFKIENVVYDKNSNELLFTDVFPSEAQLINTTVELL